MTLPFSIPRPNMDSLRIDRLNLFSRGGHDPDRLPDNQNQDDQFARQLDVEAQTPEMTERGSPPRRPSRFSRPAIPSFISTVSSRIRGPGPRPTSSYYSGEAGDDMESPKSPEFRLGIPSMPSTRLHLPNLARTWTQGSNGPPTRPGTAQTGVGGGDSRPSFSWLRGNAERGQTASSGVTEPVPSVPPEHIHTYGLGQHSRNGSQTQLTDEDPAQSDTVERDTGRRHRRGGSNGSSSAGGRRDGVRDVEGGDERRRRRRRRREIHGRRENRPTPKHFLFCFPWVKSRRVRSQILRCFVSGIFLTLMLTIYLALSITRNINNSEFTVLLILLILFVTIFFCHGLIRLCLLIVRGTSDSTRDSDGNSRARAGLPQMYGPGGYAIPRKPIRVVLARDEEAAGIESDATKTDPPAYGLWRQSVRVDPNRIYWMRNENVSPAVEEEEDAVEHTHGSNIGSSLAESSSNASSDGGTRAPLTRAPRPPSYVSDDGVSYVVEAQPRSIAPTTEVLLVPHPAEVGRIGRPSDW